MYIRRILYPICVIYIYIWSYMLFPISHDSPNIWHVLHLQLVFKRRKVFGLDPPQVWIRCKLSAENWVACPGPQGVEDIAATTTPTDELFSWLLPMGPMGHITSLQQDLTGEPYVCCAGLCPCGPLGEPQDHPVVTNETYRSMSDLTFWVYLFWILLERVVWF